MSNNSKYENNPQTIGQWISWVLWGPWAFGQLIFLLSIVFLIRTIGFGLYQVPSGSMETTMLVGERFFADKFTYAFLRAPKRGEVISMNNPLFKYSKNPLKYYFQYYVWGPDNWTKRIIGQPGDHVQGIVENGVPFVYLNGKKLNESCYRNKYPLIKVLNVSRESLQEQVRELMAYYIAELRQKGQAVDPEDLRNYCEHMISESNVTSKSFDPLSALDQQPFYRMRPEAIVPSSDRPALINPDDAWQQAHNQGSSQPNREWNGSDIFDVKLGENEYWLMGDNRRGSSDSRAMGPVPLSSIHGRILFRIWSHDSAYSTDMKGTWSNWLHSWFIVELVLHPIDFWNRMRWNRFFQYLPAYDGMCDVAGDDRNSSDAGGDLASYSIGDVPPTPPTSMPELPVPLA